MKVVLCQVFWTSIFTIAEVIKKMKEGQKAEMLSLIETMVPAIKNKNKKTLKLLYYEFYRVCFYALSTSCLKE